MEVIATRRGFDGLVLRSKNDGHENFVPEVFNFDGFKMTINDDLEIQSNLGTWMKLTEKGQKDFDKMAKSLIAKKKKDLEKQQKESS